MNIVKDIETRAMQKLAQAEEEVAQAGGMGALIAALGGGAAGGIGGHQLGASTASRLDDAIGMASVAAQDPRAELAYIKEYLAATKGPNNQFAAALGAMENPALAKLLRGGARYGLPAAGAIGGGMAAKGLYDYVAGE